MEVWDNNTNSVNLLRKLFDLAASGSAAQAHYPEVCLAWMMSQDDNYNRGASVGPVPGAYRIIRINCPVDVNVYDGSNSLVASIVGDVPQDVGSSIICILNDKGEKILYLPADEDYSISITATDDGEMTYSVSEYNLANNGVSRLINYYHVPIRRGDTFTGLVAAFSALEIENGIPDGSSVDYALLNSSSLEVSNREELFRDEIADSYFKVSVKADNDSGFVDGSGTFIKGSYAKVTAMPLSGGRLLGWYVDNRLVSTDVEYRFAVMEDTNITARFAEVEKHKLNLQAGIGGRITSVEGNYTAGSEIAVVAEADAGYQFIGWTATQGTFDAAANTYAWFTMPDADVTVTANFKPLAAATYTITYNANGGANAPAAQVEPKGTHVPLSTKEPTRQGYTFLGWSTAQNAKTVEYTPGMAYTGGTDVTLYAVWMWTSNLFDVRMDDASIILRGNWANERNGYVTFWVSFNGNAITQAQLNSLTLSGNRLPKWAGALKNVNTYGTPTIRSVKRIGTSTYSEVRVPVSVYSSSVSTLSLIDNTATLATAYIITPGDVEQTYGSLNAADVAQAVRVINKIPGVAVPRAGLANDFAFEMMDMDANGRIDASDVAVLYRLICNIIKI